MPLTYVPYGREVAAALRAGRVLNVFLYACRPDPWRRAKLRRAGLGPASALVLPVDADPLALRWPPVREVVADISNLPGDVVNALARALVRDGLHAAMFLDRLNSARNLCVHAKRPHDPDR